jgi:uncharacterized protein (DUF697 family)
MQKRIGGAAPGPQPLRGSQPFIQPHAGPILTNCHDLAAALCRHRATPPDDADPLAPPGAQTWVTIESVKALSLPFKMANVRRVLGDVNLDAIRTSAESRFVMPIVADHIDDAIGVAASLSIPDYLAPHPWLIPIDAADGVPALPMLPLAGILISRTPKLSAALATTRDQLNRDRIPVITIIVDEETFDEPPVPGERARIHAPSIDTHLARDLGATLAGELGPDWRLALARQLPAVRGTVVTALIEEAAHANAGYALATGLAEVVPFLTVPLNLGDIVVLTKNQLVMGYRIALACGLEGDARRLIPEIVGVLGGGLLLRQVARQLVGLIPVLGIVPKVAIAYGGTYAIGRVVATWASEGRAASSEVVQRFAREGLDRGRDVARSLVQRARDVTARDRQVLRDRADNVRPSE